MSESIGSRANQNYGKRESCQVLLGGDFSIDRYEHVELRLGKREKIAVLDSGPTLSWDGRDGVADQIVRQPSIDALVE